jgi:hypothetical protein
LNPTPPAADELPCCNALVIIGGFVLIGLACFGFWQGLKLKPYDDIPPSKGSWWRT